MILFSSLDYWFQNTVNMLYTPEGYNSVLLSINPIKSVSKSAEI